MTTRVTCGIFVVLAALLSASCGGASTPSAPSPPSPPSIPPSVPPVVVPSTDGVLSVDNVPEWLREPPRRIGNIGATMQMVALNWAPGSSIRAVVGTPPGNDWCEQRYCFEMQVRVCREASDRPGQMLFFRWAWSRDGINYLARTGMDGQVAAGQCSISDNSAAAMCGQNPNGGCPHDFFFPGGKYVVIQATYGGHRNTWEPTAAHASFEIPYNQMN